MQIFVWDFSSKSNLLVFSRFLSLELKCHLFAFEKLSKRESRVEVKQESELKTANANSRHFVPLTFNEAKNT